MDLTDALRAIYDAPVPHYPTAFDDADAEYDELDNEEDNDNYDDDNDDYEESDQSDGEKDTIAIDVVDDALPVGYLSHTLTPHLADAVTYVKWPGASVPLPVTSTPDVPEVPTEPMYILPATDDYKLTQHLASIEAAMAFAKSLPPLPESST